MLSEIAVMRNVKNLKLALRRYTSDGAYSIIFRPYLMQFIAKHHKTANVIIDSFAGPGAVISNIILIER